MKSMLIAIAIISSTLLAQQCDTIQQQYNVYATVNETQEWDMSKYFFTGENLKYSINGDCPYFEIINPISQIGNPVPHPDLSIGRVRSLKPLISFENGFWLNDFIFLEQNKTYVDVFIAIGDSQQMNVVPEFKTQRNVRNETVSFTCFDLDFISPTRIAVDCYQTDLDYGNMNGFLVIDFANPNYYNILATEQATGYNYNQTVARKILFHNYTFNINSYGQGIKVGEPLIDGLGADVGQFLFRGEPAWATEQADLSYNKLDDDCELEVFEFENNQQLVQSKPVVVLSKVELANLLGEDVRKVKFYLIDFQIEPNGDIYVLDAYNGVYVLRLSQSREWTLKNLINIPELTNCIGFDSNYLLNNDGTYVNHLILVYSTKAYFYENHILKLSIKLPRTATYDNLQVQMSQQYIVIRFDTFVYLYHSDDGSLISTYNGDELDQLIINPYEPEMIVVNKVSSHRYLLSNGFLRLIKQDSFNDGLKSYSLVATKIDQPTNKCLGTLNVQVLRKPDINIYPSSSYILPSILTIPSDPIKIGEIASGPNLEYLSTTTMQNDKLKQLQITIQSSWDLKLNNVNLPDAKEVVYSDIIVNDIGQQFHLLLQNTSKDVQIYQCNYKLSDHENADCIKYITFPLNSVIDKSKNPFIWWIDYGQINYMYQDTDYSIQIYSCVDGKSELVGTLFEPNPTAYSKFTSIKMLTNAIYVVQEGLRVVKVYETNLPFRQIYIIDVYLMAQFNAKGYFTPKSVFGNKIVNSQIVFIQSLDYLFVGEFTNINKEGSYILLKQIPITPGSTVEVAIGLTNFFIVQRFYDQDSIEEYNIQNTRRIYKTKNLPLYHYQLENPLTVDFTSQTGWLFVRAKDGNETVILVYEPGVISHNCLHKVIETKLFNNDGYQFDMSGDGGKQMFVYFNNNKTHRVVSILEYAQLYLSPDVDEQQYVNDILSQIQVSNYPGNPSLTVFARMTILNTQTNANIKQEVLNQKQLYFNKTSFYMINMGADWYTGQVTQFQVFSEQYYQPGELSIISNIYRATDGYDMMFAVSDGIQFGSYGQVYQESKSLIFQDMNGRLQSKLLLNITMNKKCEMITVSDDASFIVSSWTEQIAGELQIGLFFTKCTNGSKCQKFRQGSYQLASVVKIAKLNFKDSRNLIILNADLNNFESFNNYILVNKFYSDESEYSISTVYTINNQYVGVKLLQIGDFDVIQYKLNGATYNTILFTDINNGLYFAHFVQDSAGIFSKTTYELFDLKSNINEQYYVNRDTKFYQVKVINNQIVGTNLQLTILITTSNTAQYILYFELNGSKPTFGLPIIKAQTSLQYTLTPYGTWQSLNKLVYLNGFVVIPYSNDQRIVFGVYQLPSEKTNVVQSIPFSHGIGADYNNALQDDFILILNKNSTNKYPYFYTNIYYERRIQEYLVQQYEMKEGPQIILQNSENFPDKFSVQVVAMNDFVLAVGQVNLTESNNNFQVKTPF